MTIYKNTNKQLSNKQFIESMIVRRGNLATGQPVNRSSKAKDIIHGPYVPEFRGLPEPPTWSEKTLEDALAAPLFTEARAIENICLPKSFIIQIADGLSSKAEMDYPTD